ncbi:hypothetical protein PIROE2DRAFT_18800 [Piromyces sp. E2]|nr:hypothetical protein PIROE2DRAFT_18800 [Piromyces sp. E2]|eukprot:OUM56548.1 hypothetical protein PIROE2DRAFT_18800 [Piromyces sp. E2]
MEFDNSMRTMTVYDSNYNCIDVLNVGILFNNKEMVNAVIESQDINVNQLSSSGLTPLTLACLMSNEKLVKVLFRHGALANIEDNYGTLPLVYADKINNVKIKNILYRNGANPYLPSTNVNESLIDLFKKEKII